MNTPKQEAKLESWRWWLGADGALVLVGRVTGHPEFPTDHFIHTSEIIAFNLDRGVAASLHTYYKLGEPYVPHSYKVPMDQDNKARK